MRSIAKGETNSKESAVPTKLNPIPTDPSTSAEASKENTPQSCPLIENMKRRRPCDQLTRDTFFCYLLGVVFFYCVCCCNPACMRQCFDTFYDSLLFCKQTGGTQ